MRFGLAHRVMTDSLALLGLAALLTSGKLHPIATVLVCVGTAAALGLPERMRQHTAFRLMGAVVPVAALVIQVARLLLRVEPIPVVVEFAAVLQVVRLLTRRGAAHDHQVILLALLHLIAGTVLGGGLAYGVALLGFLVLTPGALMLSHLRREVEGNYRQGARDRTGMPVDVPRILRSRRVIQRGFLLLTCVLSLPIFVTTALIFLIFPRVGFTWLMVNPVQPARVVGFSDRVDLGGVGTLRTDPTLVLRVVPGELPPEPPIRKNLYLRGAVFDSYQDRSWQRVAKTHHHRDLGEGMVYLTRQVLPGDEKWTLELEPITPPVLFFPSHAVAFQILDRNRRPGRFRAVVTVKSHGEIEYASADQTGISYDVFVNDSFIPVDRTPPEFLEPYLQLPADFSPRVRELGSIWASGLTDPAQIAYRFEQRLRSEYRYDLSSPSGAAKDPLDHFLFVSKAGHCEFYSTAMALLLRTQGIPSRNVTGFVGGTLNRFGGFYAVRQGDAHSWIEAYLPQRGWTRFDPTPPSSARPLGSTQTTWATLRELFEAAGQTWDQHVVGFDLDQQVSLFQSLRDQFRSKPSGTGASSASNFGWRQVGLGLVLVGGGALVVRYWRRRRSAPVSRPSIERGAQRSIELYQRLERTLEGHGISRPPSMAPRSHALALVGAGHPVGPEVLRLTDRYLLARFGGVPMSPAEDRDFVETIRKISQTPTRREAA